MLTVKALVPLIALLVGSTQAAKTDLAGCSLTSVALLTEIVTVTAANGQLSSFGNYAETAFQWDGTEQCQLIDCGGGRAPPKTTVPGCPLYTGTDTVPSLPFPTASLTLTTAAPSTTAAAPADASSAGPSATATPAATSASPQATETASPSGSPSPGAIAAAGPQSAAEAPSGTQASDKVDTPSVTTTTSSSGSGTATTGSNNHGQRSSRTWEGAVVGFAAVAAAAVQFL